MTNILLSGFSKEEIESKIDEFLKTEQEYNPIGLIMPVEGASKYEYRGFTVRQWNSAAGDVRFDTAVSVADEV